MLLLLSCCLAVTGCNTINQWTEDNPTEAQYAKNVLLTGLYFVAANNPKVSAYKEQIAELIKSQGNVTPERLALTLQQELGRYLDKATQDELYSIWVEELQNTKSNFPANGLYSLQLADSLDI